MSDQTNYERCDNCGKLYNGDESDLGYIDPGDNTIWENVSWLTEQQVQSTAHLKFCCIDCLDNYLWKLQEAKNE